MNPTDNASRLGFSVLAPVKDVVDALLFTTGEILVSGAWAERPTGASD